MHPLHGGEGAAVTYVEPDVPRMRIATITLSAVLLDRRREHASRNEKRLSDYTVSNNNVSKKW